MTECFFCGASHVDEANYCPSCGQFTMRAQKAARRRRLRAEQHTKRKPLVGCMAIGLGLVVAMVILALIV